VRIDSGHWLATIAAMKFLAISGSARAGSTNTALLRALQDAVPRGIELSVFDGVGRLPVFSPDLDGPNPPDAVRRFMRMIEESDGLIVSSPEYVRSIPGGLKNAIDWLVSGEAIVDKPVALAHASHRGDDMLESLRAVLSTVSGRFTSDIFLRLPLMKMQPAEISRIVGSPEHRSQAQAYLQAFALFCADGTKPAGGSMPF
jgi:chromate reductase, NAD(P)H dehydrogenase (quinone)